MKRGAYRAKDKKANATQAILNGMGNTADEVASWLRKYGFRGRRGSSSECPIAKALTFLSGDKHHVSLLYASTHDAAGDEKLAWMGSPCRRFVFRFDYGTHYADLNEENQ